MIARVWAYETGQLKPEEIVTLFHDLWKSGDIWLMPTKYLDNAGEMMTRGYFTVGVGQVRN